MPTKRRLVAKIRIHEKTDFCLFAASSLMFRAFIFIMNPLQDTPGERRAYRSCSLLHALLYVSWHMIKTNKYFITSKTIM